MMAKKKYSNYKVIFLYYVYYVELIACKKINNF